MDICRICLFIGLIGATVFGPLYASSASAKEPQDVIVFNAQQASRGKAGMPPARFSHSTHKKNKCSDCHPSIFAEKIGADIVTMKKNAEGEYCGKCHNLMVAFDLSNCYRCHKK